MKTVVHSESQTDSPGVVDGAHRDRPAHYRAMSNTIVSCVTMPHKQYLKGFNAHNARLRREYEICHKHYRQSHPDKAYNG